MYMHPNKEQAKFKTGIYKSSSHLNKTELKQ